MEASLGGDLTIRGVKHLSRPAGSGKPAVEYDVNMLAIKGMDVKSGKDGERHEVRFSIESDVSWRRLDGGSAPADSSFLKGTLGTGADSPIVMETSAAATAVSATLILDGADICFLDALPFVYRKAAGVPCRVEIAASAGPDGSAKIGKAEIKGGPVELTAEEMAYRPLEREHFGLSLKKLAVAGPISLSFADVTADTARDRLAFRISAPENDLSRLNPVLRFPQKFDIEGVLGAVDLRYDGKYSLLAGTPPATNKAAGGGKEEGAKIAPPAAPASTIGRTDVTMKAGKEGSDGFRRFTMRFDRADFDLANGRFSVAGLAMGAPPRFREKDPVQIKNIGISVKPESLSSNLLEVLDISVEGMSVSYEVGLGSTNIGRILDDMNYFEACMSGPEKPKGESKGEGAAKKSSAATLIRNLVVRETTVSVSQALLKEATAVVPKKSLPTITASDIRTDNVLAAVPAVAGRMLMPAIEAGRDIAAGIKDALKATGDALVKDARDMGKDIKDMGKDLKDIFRPAEKKSAGDAEAQDEKKKKAAEEPDKNAEEKKGGRKKKK